MRVRQRHILCAFGSLYFVCFDTLCVCVTCRCLRATLPPRFGLLLRTSAGSMVVPFRFATVERVFDRPLFRAGTFRPRSFSGPAAQYITVAFGCIVEPLFDF